MKLANWFKVTWWAVLTTLATLLLYSRYPILIAGRSTVFDLLVFALWIGLLLAPLFSEISLLGVSLKQSIEKLKDQLVSQINEIRNDVRNAVDVHTNFSPQINLPLPAPDSQLPALEERIKATVAEALASRGVSVQEAGPADIAVDSNTAYLFEVRYNLEKEVRRIASNRGIGGSENRPLNAIQLLSLFARESETAANLQSAIRDVWAICSRAMHAAPVSKAQVDFVRDTAPQLIGALKAID